MNITPQKQENKAITCINIAEKLFPLDSKEDTENKAIEMMHMCDEMVYALAEALNVMMDKMPGASNSVSRYNIIKGG